MGAAFSIDAEGEEAGAHAEIKPTRRSGAKVFMIESVRTISIA